MRALSFLTSAFRPLSSSLLHAFALVASCASKLPIPEIDAVNEGRALQLGKVPSNRRHGLPQVRGVRETVPAHRSSEQNESIRQGPKKA